MNRDRSGLYASMRFARRLARSACAALVVLCLSANACVQIPAEAPQLSAELGKRITAFQNAHLTMLHRFMADRRARVDEFIEKEWIPTFSRELTESPTFGAMWEKVAASHDPSDRMKFLVLVAPQIQEKINAKRMDLIAPLDEIERTIEQRLRDDYQTALAVNNSITSYLESAAELAANRDRYIAMAQEAAGTHFDLDKHLDKAAEVVDGLVEKRDAVQGRVENLEQLEKDFRAKANELLSMIRGLSK